MKISLSTYYSKKKAQEIVENELQSVGLHIAKIWVHKPSDYDSKWENDISDYFIKIVRVSNNTANGKLKKSWLVDKLCSYFDLAVADCPRVYKDDQYTLEKCDVNPKKSYRNAQECLVPKLIKSADTIADIIAQNDYESYSNAAKLIAKIVIKERNTFYNITFNVSRVL